MVLTFELQLEEALEPKYRGLQLVHKWFLKAIKGEPACPGELPLKVRLLSHRSVRDDVLHASSGVAPAVPACLPR
jgi:hypothetical protein